MKMNRFFTPGTNSPMANLGLLVLRVWIGIAMLLNHGWDKLIHFSDKAQKFPDLLHLGSPAANLALVVFAEVLCSALLVIGLLTRFAALVLTINMAVAFFIAHKMALSGERSGELAFIYLAVYVALLITGPDRYSIDASLFKAGAKQSSAN
jgi:putative oxidoreductase